MILEQLIVDNIVIGVLNYIPTVKFIDTLEEGYQDITSLANIDSFWNLTDKDYKFARSVMKNIVSNIGFDNLSSNEKIIASKWFAIDMSIPLSEGIISFDDSINFGKIFNENSKNSRDKRMNAVEAIVWNRLGIDNSNIIINDVSIPTDLINLYITFGREGIQSGDPAGLYDYIQATSETIYATNGLAAKGWTPLDGTNLSDVIQDIMSVLISGTY